MALLYCLDISSFLFLLLLQFSFGITRENTIILAVFWGHAGDPLGFGLFSAQDLGAVGPTPGPSPGPLWPFV